MSSQHRWHAHSDDDVHCIACGTEVARTEAREYDKHGDRFDRDDKQFEYLCKPCYREYSHQPRDGLEATLVEAGAGTTDDDTFLEQYCDIATKEVE